MQCIPIESISFNEWKKVTDKFIKSITPKINNDKLYIDMSENKDFQNHFYVYQYIPLYILTCKIIDSKGSNGAYLYFKNFSELYKYINFDS